MTGSTVTPIRLPDVHHCPQPAQDMTPPETGGMTGHPAAGTLQPPARSRRVLVETPYPRGGFRSLEK